MRNKNFLVLTSIVSSVLVFGVASSSYACDCHEEGCHEPCGHSMVGVSEAGKVQVSDEQARRISGIIAKKNRNESLSKGDEKLLSDYLQLQSGKPSVTELSQVK